MATVRKNITMSEELASWFEERSKKMGVSQSALMTMALQFYTEYQQAINMGSDMKYIIDQLAKEKK